tara:strand:+ start:14493 stop:15905 length:1413 start_codon:yes stop_codon:yes gene_type:complete
MLLERPLGLARMLVILQIMMAMTLMLITFAILRPWIHYEGFAYTKYLSYMVLFVAVMVVEFLTRPIRLQNVYCMPARMMAVLSRRQVVFPFLALLGAMFLLKETMLSRSYLLVFGALFSGLIAISNFRFLPYLANFCISKTNKEVQSILLVANQADADNFAQRVANGEFLGIDLAGYIEIGNGEPSKDGVVPCLGSLEDIESICDEAKVSGLAVVNYHEFDDVFDSLAKYCEYRSIRFVVVDGVRDRLGENYAFYQFGGNNFYVSIPEPLEDPVNQLLKRGLDIAVSLFALAVTMPLASLLVFTIHRMYSPGPLFYRQERVGKDGKRFQIFKFRTMTVAHDQDGVQATKNDVRLFPGGGFLRKVSIDELPQFINVLLGHMSVVGPRPHYISHDESFKEVAKNYPVRQFTKPGITGLAQVNGCRGEIKQPADLLNRVRWDIEYIRSWTPWLDLKIIMMTLRETVWPSSRAY